jgi:hypothetical protein
MTKYQYYLFMKRPKDYLWSYSSFRTKRDLNANIKEGKSLGFTKFKITKLPIRDKY